jgi:hypothetical protein
MAMILRLIAMFCVTVVACAAHESAAGGARPTAQLRKLPRVFAGIDWGTDEQGLRRLFPKAEADTVPFEDEGREAEAIEAGPVAISPFGPAAISVVRRKGEPAYAISLTTVEPREACEPMSGDGPADCRNRYGATLSRVFRVLEAELSRELGKGRPGEPLGNAHGFLPDAREKTLVWKQEGFQLSLALGREEHAGWVVSLQALRPTNHP